MPVTLAQIAALAKAHPSTVSLVLNSRQYGRVSRSTRERIEAIANELGYRVNRHAQGLVRGSTKTVALVLNQLSNPFFGRYVSGIEASLERFGYYVMPFETRADNRRESELMTLQRQGICDLVLSLSHYEKESDESLLNDHAVVRIVDWDGKASMRCGYSHVAVDYQAATAQLFDHLVETGRSRLGLVLHRTNEPFPGHPQESVYASTLRSLIGRSQLICSEKQQVVAHENDDLQAWHDAAFKLLSRDPKIDALLVHTTEFIAPVIEAARKLGRRIGHDLALATFDDPPFAAWIEGGVTVVREPIPEVAAALSNQVISLLQGNGRQPNQIIHAQFVGRASTRPRL